MLVRSLILVLLSVCAAPVLAQPVWSDPAGTGLETGVRSSHALYGVPALGAVVVTAGGEVETFVTGVRRVGTAERVGPDDAFHLGSNAKSILATALGRHVERGALRWEATLADLFGLAIPDLDPAYRSATLRQLLAHAAGLPALTTGAEIDSLGGFTGTERDQRLALARRVLSAPPAYASGSRSVYSNAGYVIASLVLEAVSGMPWRDALRADVFEPLGARPVFGHPGRAGSGPWGHVRRGEALEAWDPAEATLPEWLSPAGDLSLSLPDYGRYLVAHLRGLRGEDTELLRAETVRALHECVPTEDGCDYSLGWAKYDLGGEAASIHKGSDGSFTSVVAVLPVRGVAVASVTNSGDHAGDRAATSFVLSRLEE